MIRSNSEFEITRRRAAVLEDTIEGLKQEYGNHPEYFEALAAPFRNELLGLRRQIDEYVGMTELPSSDVVLRIEGEGIREGAALGSILAERLVALRKAVVSIAEALAQGHPREAGRPLEDIAQLADFSVVGLAAGSLKLAVDFPTSVRQERLEGAEAPATPRSYVRKAVELLIEGGEWVSSAEPTSELPADLAASPAFDALMLKLRQLSPSPKGKLSRVWIEGRDISPGKAAVLTRDSRARAIQVLRKAEGAIEFEDVGKLRAMRFDADREIRDLVLRERTGGKEELDCDFEDALRPDVFRAVLTESRVRVRGILRTIVGPPKKSVLSIEELEFLRDTEAAR